jgi:hypothetical protein
LAACVLAFAAAFEEKIANLREVHIAEASVVETSFKSSPFVVPHRSTVGCLVSAFGCALPLLESLDRLSASRE